MDLKNKFNLAVQACEKHEYEKARTYLNEIINEYPDNPNLSEAYRLLCQLSFEEGKDDEAMNLLITALVKDPKNMWALIMMGNILGKRKKDINAARGYFNKVLEYYPGNAIALNNNFYEPHGVHLISSDFSKNKTLSVPYLEKKGFNGSIAYLIDSPNNNYNQEMNVEEGQIAAELVKELYAQGLTHEDVAIVTPFRLQVRTIRECVSEALPKGSPLPLIDTVERLQGQDVVCVIISFSVSDESYLKSMKSFLFQPNRLNVMISRAKKKVVFIASKAVMEEWKKINKNS